MNKTKHIPSDYVSLVKHALREKSLLIAHSAFEAFWNNEHLHFALYPNILSRV